jgi:16S rRNA (adenine1518-N6/adenine1519-N6)-dimethyltransferase
MTTTSFTTSSPAYRQNLGEHWVEIGPGQGALTEPLLKEGIRLDVVELDRDLVVFAKEKIQAIRQLCKSTAPMLRI